MTAAVAVVTDSTAGLTSRYGVAGRAAGAADPGGQARVAGQGRPRHPGPHRPGSARGRGRPVL